MSELTILQKRWLNEIKEIPQCRYVEPQKLNNLLSILYAYTTLAVEVNKKRRDRYDQLEAISRYFFAHIYQLGSGVFQLSKTGLGTAGLILSRSILEGFIDASYLWLCKLITGDDLERDAWAEYYSISHNSIRNKWEQFEMHRRKQGAEVRQDLFDLDTVKEYKEKATEFTQKYGRGHWTTKSLDIRARAVDDTQKLHEKFPELLLEEEYLFYKLTSETTHGESSTVRAYLNQSDNTMLLGESSKNIQAAIGMAGNYMLVYGWVYTKINHLDYNLITSSLEETGFKI